MWIPFRSYGHPGAAMPGRPVAALVMALIVVLAGARPGFAAGEGGVRGTGGAGGTSGTSGQAGVVRYDLTIAGVSVGDAALAISPGDASLYRISFDMTYRFLFWRGGAAATTVGQIDRPDRGAGPVPTGYRMTVTGMSEPLVIDTAFDDAGPRVWSITPPPDAAYLEERVPLTKADLAGAIDPLSAMFIRAATAAEACDRTLPAFTGGTRLDLVLKPGAQEGGSTEDGVHICEVSYRPVSGHRPDSESVARLKRNSPDLSIFEVAPASGHLTGSRFPPASARWP